MDNLLEFNREQLTKYIEGFGHKPYRAKQLLRWIYYFNENNFDYSFSEYAISTAFPQTTIRSGFTMRYNFGN